MSTWNKLGGSWTWEERDFSSWGAGRLKELIKSKGSGIDASVDSIGDEATATVLFLHGKKRLGYEFGDVKIRVTSGKGGFKGVFVVPEISSENGTESFEIRIHRTEVSGNTEETKAVLQSVLKESVTTFTEELAAKVA